MTDKSKQSAAIGVFDSGVGGISVLRHIHALLPTEHLIYVADSAHAPYGGQSVDYICERVLCITHYLEHQDVKALVVACNTATAAAIEMLRAHTPIPVIGMEPAVKPAATLTRSGVVGVLTTTGTLESDRFAALVEQHGQGVQVIVQGCVGLVEQIELGQFQTSETVAMLKRYVLPLLEQGADTLVLGCTHYPFVASIIREIAGNEVTIVDTGPAVARQLKRKLNEHHLLTSSLQLGEVSFVTSGETQRVQTIIKQLWGEESKLIHLSD